MDATLREIVIAAADMRVAELQLTAAFAAEDQAIKACTAARIAVSDATEERHRAARALIARAIAERIESVV